MGGDVVVGDKASLVCEERLAEEPAFGGDGLDDAEVPLVEGKLVVARRSGCVEGHHLVAHSKGLWSRGWGGGWPGLCVKG